jgi:hypothetical protein
MPWGEGSGRGGLSEAILMTTKNVVLGITNHHNSLPHEDETILAKEVD